MSVSGATYTKTRVRGLAPWHPRPGTVALLAQIRLILEAYSAQLPLSGRQIFYILVGQYDYPKTEQGAAKLGDVLSRARRAQLIPFNAIRDDGTLISHPDGFYGVAAFFDSLEYWAENYRNLVALSTGQDVAVELWCEAAGMVPQMERLAHPLGALVTSGGGFHSVTDKHDAAQRIVNRDRPTVVLQVGDHDPSGCSIIDSAADDITTFVVDLGGDVDSIHFERVAVTPEQIDRYRLPTAPPKATDRRGDWEGGTVQAEALDPADLADEVNAALADYIDLDAIAAAEEVSAAERAQLVAAVRRLREDDL